MKAMTQLLKKGTICRGSLTGYECNVTGIIGSGGQGEVYIADVNGQPMALKWYFKASATPEQYRNLKYLIRIGAPNARYLWPVDVVEGDGVDNFGYIMPLRENRFKSLFDLMYRRIDPSFSAIVEAGRQLADSFHQLHAKGLCYRDISFGNVFFDPSSGQVLICDNDNVVENGKTGGIIGTPDFMAPEIVRGEAHPSTSTDLFSLSVLLFYLMHIHHPLFGKRLLKIHVLDLPARTKLCGREPLFIFDPDDKGNEAVGRDVDKLGEAGANALIFWKIYPQHVRDLFTKAFTKGLHDPSHGRVSETIWRKTMQELQDSILYCGNCRAENFYDFKETGKTGSGIVCWSCARSIVLPPRLRTERSTIMLNYDTKIYEHQIDPSIVEYDLPVPVGEMNQNPKDKSIWGLKNLQNQNWSITTADGKTRDVRQNQSVPIYVGTKISFPRTRAEILM